MSLLSRLFSLPFWSQIFQSFLDTCQRFPLSVLSLIVINLVIISDINNLDILTDQQQKNTFLIALGGALWFAATRLLSERLQWPKSKQYILALPVFALYAWFITQHSIITPESVVLILAAGLAITFAAYITRRSDNASVWYFNYQLITAICFALLSAIILCSGLGLILKSLEYLFEFSLTSKPYQNIWAIGMAFLAPVYFLTNIPKQFDYPRSDCDFPKGVHFILRYILVPLSLVYMVILYAYFIKILLQGALPHGHLGIMISWFGIIGIITHLAIYPLHDRGSSLLSWFYQYFYIMLIVPLGLLAVAIGVRIAQYGFTEQRYLVALCAVWFAILIILNLLKREQFQLKFVTISLAILSVLITFGPWGIHQLPINSQFSRLEATLIEENLLTNGKLNIIEQPSAEVQKSISSIVNFLVEHHAENRIRPWVADKEAFDQARECNPVDGGCPSAEQKIVELMGLNYIHYWEDIKRDNISIQLGGQFQHNRTLAVTGYDTLTKISWLSSQQQANPPQWGKSEYALSINENSQLLIAIDDDLTIIFNLLDITKQFSKQIGRISVDAAQADKLRLTQTVNGIKATLYVDDLQIWRNKGEIDNTTLTGYLLVKAL
ncbi:MAG: hypothetical protein COA83_04920 [Methylophaga sp.]|nr:MAG: hypothetical protein COA83_04920 [Methylophaga sp.]